MEGHHVIDGIVYKVSRQEDGTVQLTPVNPVAASSNSTPRPPPTSSLRSRKRLQSACLFREKDNEMSEASTSRRQRSVSLRSDGNAEDLDDMDKEEEEEEDYAHTQDVGTKSDGRRMKRAYWTSDQYKCFLELCFDKHVQQKQDGQCGKLRHALVYDQVAVLLNKEKLRDDKSGLQCKIKYKKAKEIYSFYMKNKGKSGAGGALSEQPECWEELSRLFHRRRSVTSASWGFESGASGDSESPPLTPEPLEETRENQPSSSYSSPNLPPKYRAGTRKWNSTPNLLRELMERQASESKEMEQTMRSFIQDQAAEEDKLLQGFQSILREGFALLAGVLNPGQPPQQQAQQQISTPQHTSSPPLSTTLAADPTANHLNSPQMTAAIPLKPPHQQITQPTASSPPPRQHSQEAPQNSQPHEAGPKIIVRLPSGKHVYMRRNVLKPQNPPS